VIEGLKPYAEYKETGLPWLDNVPKHWVTKRGKSYMTPLDVRSKTGKEELLTVSSAYGVVLRRTAKVTMFKAESYVGYKLCWPGDLVINSLWAWAGGLGVSPYHGIISTAYSVYRPRHSARIDPRFLHELVRSAAFNWELQVRSKGIWISRLQLTDTSFLDAPIPLPPPDEQAAIVRFLDHANRKVDGFIRAKRKLIALLGEQKQAIIHRAVTRGLDPDVPLKPSGIPWVGDIPAHWGALQVRRVVSFVTSGSRSWANHYSDDGFVFVQSGNLGRSMALNFTFTQYVCPPPGTEGERTRVQLDDVLICITGALTGNVVHVHQEISVPPS
jgi:type I restriction enzyme S subunit